MGNGRPGRPSGEVGPAGRSVYDPHAMDRSASRPRPHDLRTDPEAARQAALEALDRGQLVVVPTETVYGVAAREDRPEAVARLQALKNERRKPYSLAVGTPDVLADRLLPLTAPARRAAGRWWPGPVTLVLPTREGGTLGVRVVGHDWTRSLLEACPAPVWLPSANRPGEPAPTDLEGLDPAVHEQVEVVVDGGACALGNASSVLQPGPAAVSVLREGVVSREDARKHLLGTVLVVCSGNTCRSPMAAALLRRALARRAEADPGLLLPEVFSAGTFAGDGAPASGGSLRAMETLGLDIEDHSSRALIPERLERCDVLLGMTLGHLDAARELVGDRPVVLDLFYPAGREVDDPFGAPDALYLAVARELEAMAEARAASLCPPTPGDPS